MISNISLNKIVWLSTWCILMRVSIVHSSLVTDIPTTTTSEQFQDANFLPVASTTMMAADVTWEMTYGLEGWAQATSEEMHAETYHMSGEMRISIEGPEAHIDSPRMRIAIGDKQAIAIRYRFVGPSKFGKIRLRGGKTMPDIVDHGFTDWGEEGSTSTDDFFDVYFPIVGDGLWHIGYAKIGWENKSAMDILNGTLTQMRLWPGCLRNAKKKVESSEPPRSGNVFHIDWIRLVRAPIINRITGCSGEKHFLEASSIDAQYDIDPVISKINGILEHYRTIWKRRERNLPYSSTYNCVRKGGERITLDGSNFGLGGINKTGAPAHVFIDGLPCKFVEHDVNFPQQRLTCLTPELHLDYHDDHLHTALIEIRNGKLPELIDFSRSLRYAVPSPKPHNLVAQNFAARSIDLSWTPGGSIWDQMVCTGFKIKWREESFPNWHYSFVTGNITTTTVRGLTPNTNYVFGVAGLNEDQNNKSWWTLDLYGRRNIIDNAIEGPISTVSGRTLRYDVNFGAFNANSTQDHGPEDDRISVGPTGVTSGEGHYGLILVGDANVENCNSSSFCCDSFDEELQYCVGDSSYSCLVTSSPFPNYHEELMEHHTGSSPNEDYSNTLMTPSPFSRPLPGFGKIVERIFKNDDEYELEIDSKCGPALRLTPSMDRKRGAAWYPRQLEVGEGFDTYFTFRISNPSVRCNNMNDVHTRCRSRGGDGFAFVLQVDHEGVLGGEGQNLGYGGIHNSMAVEFDTYFNYEELDPYENHISVHTRGWRHPISANHTFSLGDTSGVPDLTDGTIRIRIKYEPIFDIDELRKPTFVSSPHMSYFFGSTTDHDHSNTDSGVGGRRTSDADWSTHGLGLLRVYCENLVDPVLIVPLHLAATLKLNRGRAWVGFTAATGTDTWQVHDILDWSFTSLRMDSEFYAPLVDVDYTANEDKGDSQCSEGDEECDYKSNSGY